MSKFVVNVNQEIFDADELEDLRNHGLQYERLMNGDRKPTTEAQERFIQVCRGELPPETAHEKAWWKYLKRLEWESDPHNRATAGPPRRAPEGFGGSREEWYEMRNTYWG